MLSIPPHNQEAEQGLLACLLIKNTLFFDVYGLVRPDDFFVPIHGEIFQKIQEFVEKGLNASPVTLKNHFENHPDLEKIGGSYYLAELCAGMPSVGNMAGYAKLVADLSERRRLLVFLSRAVDELKFENSESRPVDEIKSELMAHADVSGRGVFTRTKREVAEEAIRALQVPAVCYKTTLPSLDTAMNGGLYPGYTYGFAGAAKRGKTTLAHTISHNLNNQGIDHAYIALEMGANQIETRNIAREINVNSGAFYYDNPDVVKKAAHSLANLKNHTLYLDMAGARFDQIKAEITRLAMQKKIKGYVLDYWQLVKGGEKNQSKADFLYDVAQWCADFARRHKIWCILLAQVNKEGDTFGSAGLEKACDQLYFIEKGAVEAQNPELWLNLRFSRYTPVADIGSENYPKFVINPKGPFFDEIL